MLEVFEKALSAAALAQFLTNLYTFNAIVYVIKRVVDKKELIESKGAMDSIESIKRVEYKKELKSIQHAPSSQ